MSRSRFTSTVLPPLALAMGLAATPALLQAASGDLDPGFAGTGLTSVSIGNIKDGNNKANAVIQQADGKLVIAGFTSNGASWDFSVIRYNATGTLDTTFSGDGRASFDIGNQSDTAYDLIQQPDGKLLVVGSVQMNRANGIPDTDIALVRLNTDGTLDAGFGNNGVTVIPVANNADDEGRSIALQTDGKIVVAGYSQISNTFDFTVVRCNSDGSLDTSFDGDGKVTTSILSSDDLGYSVAIQTDGRIVVAGDTFGPTSTTDVALVRYNSNGSLDTGFGTDGKTTQGYGQDTVAIPPTDEHDHAYGLVIEPSGALVVAGSTSNGSSTDFLAMRFTNTGVLDTTFSGDGVATNSLHAGNDVARTLLQQADGKFLLVGQSPNGSNTDFAALRYNTDGTLDTTFTGDGMQLYIVNTGNDDAWGVTQQADGKLVLTGGTVAGTTTDAGLIRTALDGSLDTTFNATGRLTTTAGATINNANSVMVLPTGKLVSIGTAFVTATLQDIAMAAYNPDGTPDTSFSGDGLYTFAGSSNNDLVPAATVQSDGKIVVAGSRLNTNRDLFVARILSTGTLDTAFGNAGGKYTTAVSSTTDDSINAIIQLKYSDTNNGKLLATGYINSSTATSSSDFAMFRFLTSGSRDNSYDADGNLTTPIGANSDIAWDLVEQTDGKVVVVGQTRDDVSAILDVAVVRYNSNGSLDTSFDLDGKTTLDINSGDDVPSKVALQADGKILITGTAQVGGATDVFVVRYNTDGTLDTSFGSSGKRITSVGPLDDTPASLAAQPDGKIVIGGTANANPSNMGFVLRYDSNGNLDNTFGVGGKALVDTPKRDSIKGLAIQADGRYVFAGNTLDSITTGRLLVEDLDNDGLGDAYDNCPAAANPGQADLDNDKIGDICDADDDNDTVDDGTDNCPVLANADQANFDGDGQGNACDADDDNDGVADVSDAFPLNPAEQIDTDNDGIGNNADGDDDGDGAADTVDVEPLNAANANEIQLQLDNGYKGSTVEDTQSVP